MSEGNFAVKVWKIVYPFLFYYAVMLMTLQVARWFVGAGREHFVLCQLIASVITIPFMLPYYRQDRVSRGIAREQIFHALWAIIITACVSIALNNLISMTPLVELSAGYKEANASFYGSTLPLELLSSALATPILEELVFRGIIFGRLSDMMKKPFAIVVSAFIFAVIHFNIVQFIYAFAVGVLLAMLMDRAGNMYAAVIGHITANAIAVLRTECGFLNWSVRRDAISWVFAGVLLAAGVILLCVYEKWDYKGNG